MTDVTRLLENPMKATTIVKKIYVLLVKHVLGFPVLFSDVFGYVV
jgi:hypothetical protein